MATQPQQPRQLPVIDADNVPETLCIGPFYLSLHDQGRFATLTFTQVRPEAGSMFERNTAVDRAIVRARIVTNLPSLIALRDLLVKNVRTEGVPIAGAGSAVRH
jgi:hypothetical protein